MSLMEIAMRLKSQNEWPPFSALVVDEGTSLRLGDIREAYLLLPQFKQQLHINPNLRTLLRLQPSTQEKKKISSRQNLDFQKINSH